MPGKRPSPRQRENVKEYFRPAPTKNPIDVGIYGEQWVAIWRRAITDSDRDLHALLARLERRGLHEKAALLFVPRSGLMVR